MEVEMNNDLTQERLKELLSYDDTGIFVWKVSRKGVTIGVSISCLSCSLS